MPSCLFSLRRRASANRTGDTPSFQRAYAGSSVRQSRSAAFERRPVAVPNLATAAALKKYLTLNASRLALRVYHSILVILTSMPLHA